MSGSHTNNSLVLSCIDGSTVSQAVCDYSNWIAKTIDAPLEFLHTIQHRNLPATTDLSGAIGLGSSEDLLNELTDLEQNRSKLLIKEGNLMLQAAKQKALDCGVENAITSQRHGSLTETLVEMEEEIRVLVVGIRGEDHDDKQAGVSAQLETIVRSLHKPILVVNKTFTMPKTIMLAYDGSNAANKALQMVASSPLFKKIPCHLVHVGNEKNAFVDQLLNDAVKQLTSVGIEVTSAKLSGKIEEVLATYQAENDIDMTLMGAFSHNKVRDFLLGSFTAKMLEKTQRPLLLLR